MLVENCQFEPTSPLFDAPDGVTLANFAEIFVFRKLESLRYRTALFA